MAKEEPFQMNNTSNINPAFLPAHKLAEELRLRRISSIDLVEELLQRISAEDSKFHSFVEIYGQDAREAAAAADKAIRSGNAVGPLHGIPIALKDLIEIEGRIVTGGSASRLQHRASRTATIVNRLIAQGMI
ncbi:MAG TPA: amidase family protein, partial [Candidatus Melainabacteria bacterium]|nr:amidase family protein [Candidatus Melainabacteria bacterium]